MSPLQMKADAAAVDIDQVLQDSYLLVVQLRNGSVPVEVQQLRDRCAAQVVSVRDQLQGAGVSQASIERISYAQCALLDETVLHVATDDEHDAWAGEPLQARFFNRHQAGDFLYEELREVLRQPAPDLQVLTVYHRVLMLGFRGRYHAIDAPEREQLQVALDELIMPLQVCKPLATRLGTHTRFRYGSHSMVMHAVGAGVLLVAVWWGLNRWLAGQAAGLLAGQG